MKSNVKALLNCYGCGVCAVSCPKHIIDIKLNSMGFYEPTIENEDACIDCGICWNVCSFANDSIVGCGKKELRCYAAWSNDPEIRQTCSSGGVGFEIAKHLIDRGYKFVGVKYDTSSNKAVHYVAETKDELNASIGSKYIQSYTVDAFKMINRKDKYLVTGTPCQIDSFRRYIKRLRCEDNFVLIDFFCHGVPSMNLWKKYSKEIERITGKFIHVSWRNKVNGWHDSWDMNISGCVHEEIVGWHDSYNLLIREKKTFISHRWSQGNLFYKMFLSNSCLGKACYEKCKFKGSASSADIRIGDLWGHTYANDEKGVSSVVAYTMKGMGLLEQANCHLICHPYEVVAEGQFKMNLKEPLSRELVCRMLTTKIPLKLIFYFVQFTRLAYLLKCKLRK